jgi:hypothetical protein
MSQTRFDALRRSTGRKFAGIIDDLNAGKLTPEQFGDQLYSVLRDSHTSAYSLGLKHGGVKITRDEREALADQYGGSIADAENDYLNNFITDLEDGRYTNDDGSFKTSAIQSRANMYVGKLRATAARGFVDGSPLDSSYTWMMTAREHCTDCPRMAALSPYSADELFTMPCEGDTECLTSCKCILVRHDGVQSFI